MPCSVSFLDNPSQNIFLIDIYYTSMYKIVGEIQWRKVGSQNHVVQSVIYI